MVKVKVSRVEQDSCGKPIIVDAGEVEACDLCASRISRESELTKQLQLRASDARKIAALRDELAAERDRWKKICSLVHKWVEDEGWCPVCDEHECRAGNCDLMDEMEETNV